MRSFRLTALALALSLPCASMIFQPLASAQSTTSGDISGDLLDPTGAAIPGAKVVVKSTSTGETKTVTSNASGSYRVSLLTPGTYQVTVTAAGFSSSRLRWMKRLSSAAIGRLSRSAPATVFFFASGCLGETTNASASPTPQGARRLWPAETRWR